LVRVRHVVAALSFALAACFLSQPPPSGNGSGTEALTVKNYLSWCDVSINGGNASSAAVQAVNVDAGTLPLVATPLSEFELGTTPWHGTDGDHGLGDPGARSGPEASATITVGNAPVCVWVCCETVGAHDCPTTDLCP
jgi:hypothetical protein